MSPGFFNAVAKGFALTAIETVVLCHHDGHVQVLLTRRSKHDTIPAWRGKWHSPGSMLRASDRSYEDAFERTQANELRARFSRKPRFAGTCFHHHERGAEIALVFVCELEGEPAIGCYYDVDELPDDLISHHRVVIQTAVDHYDQG
jgi:hypothetical protein